MKSPDPQPPRPTALAQAMLEEIVGAGDVVIDATAGNGHDTMFLAAKVGETGRVLAFDVQEAAIVSSRCKVSAAGWDGRVRFHQESHASLGGRAEEGTVAAVMFNLGYLPGADHSVATGADTLKALAQAERVIRTGGALSVVCYPGHKEGRGESAEVETWIAGLSERGWRVVKYGAIGTLRPAPFLLFCVKAGA